CGWRGTPRCRTARPAGRRTRSPARVPACLAPWSDRQESGARGAAAAAPARWRSRQPADTGSRRLGRPWTCGGSSARADAPSMHQGPTSCRVHRAKVSGYGFVMRILVNLPDAPNGQILDADHAMRIAFSSALAAEVDAGRISVSLDGGCKTFLF